MSAGSYLIAFSPQYLTDPSSNAAPICPDNDDLSSNAAPDLPSSTFHHTAADAAPASRIQGRKREQALAAIGSETLGNPRRSLP